MSLRDDLAVRLERLQAHKVALTQRHGKEMAAVNKQLFGVDLNEAKAALEQAQKGDLSAVESLNTEIAAHWGTQPETSKEILKSWYKDQISGASQE